MNNNNERQNLQLKPQVEPHNSEGSLMQMVVTLSFHS